MIKGYYSVDGGAIVRARVAFNDDILNVWSRALMKGRETEFVLFDMQEERYYSVRQIGIKKGVRYYTYSINIVDREQVALYEILVDLKGYVQIDIRYGAQRTLNRLNTDYRKFFDYVKFRILEEKICRADLALTLEMDPSEVIRQITSGAYKSLLSRKFVSQIGDPESPSYIRIGTPQNVEIAIYDKRLEMMDSGYKLSYKPKMNDLLAEFGDPDFITRLEFRLFRKYLHSVEIYTPDDFNREIFSLWVTMTTRYFTPTEKPYDGHNDQKAAEWWSKLPSYPVNVKTKSTSDNVYNDLKTLCSRAWYNKHRIMMDRVEGYIASIAASMARVPDNIDNCIQIVFRRLFKEGDLIYARARSRFVLC